MIIRPEKRRDPKGVRRTLMRSSHPPSLMTGRTSKLERVIRIREVRQNLEEEKISKRNLRTLTMRREASADLRRHLTSSSRLRGLATTQILKQSLQYLPTYIGGAKERMECGYQVLTLGENAIPTGIHPH